MSNQMTMKFSVDKDQSTEIRNMLNEINTSLTSKGYNPINQLVGYLISGDPTYITSYNNARNLIRKVERDEILEELLRAYLDQ